MEPEHPWYPIQSDAVPQQQRKRSRLLKFQIEVLVFFTFSEPVTFAALQTEY